MFRLKLKVWNGRQNNNILSVEDCQLDYPYSLLIHDKNAGNDVEYTITSVRGKNIQGPYILYYGRKIDIGQFTNTNNTRAIEDGKIETPRDEAKNVVLRKPKYQYMANNQNIGGNVFVRGPCLMWGFYTGFKGETYYDERALQHIYLGKKVLITGDVTDREYESGRMKKFPSIFLQKREKYNDNIFFQLQYTDDLTRKVTNEEIEIIFELHRE